MRLRTSKSSSVVSFSYGNGSFIFGACNDDSDSRFNNSGFVSGVEKSSFTSNSNHKIDHFVFVPDKICSGANSSNRDVESVSNADESSSIMKEKGVFYSMLTQIIRHWSEVRRTKVLYMVVVGVVRVKI